MAIIKRLNITEFKEVSFENPIGLQEYTTPNGTVDPFGNPVLTGGYEINDNADFSGTTDFKGVIKTHALLAKIEVFSIDIGQLTYQQFMQMTPGQAQNMFGGGTLIENIGWVNLGETLPSFYYEDCDGVFNDPLLGRLNVPGRLPVSRPFFSLGKLNIDIINNRIRLVNGEENGRDALNVIGEYPVQQNNILTFGPNPLQYPGMPPIFDPQQYLRFIINPNGMSIIPGQGGFQNSVTITSDPKTVELQRSYRDIVINPDNPRYRANDSDTTESGYVYDDGVKLRWSEPWLIIPESFPAGLFGPNQNIGSLGTWESENGGRSEGQCIPFPDIEEPQGPTDGGVGGGPDIVTPDTGVDDEIDFDFDFGCPEPYPINLPPYDVVTTDEINRPFDLIEFNINGIQDTIELLRSEYQFQEQLFGQRDPREPFMESYTSKNGIIHLRINRKKCTADVYPALRDKDGDIPEPIGPAMSNYFKNVRKRISSLYGIDGAILTNIGSGSDGYDYYSDGNSYVELLGETVIGCGDPISFGLDIPEIRSEIINNMEEKFFYTGNNSVPSPYSALGTNNQVISSVKNTRQAITLHTIDLLHGILSGQKYFPREDSELLRLINLGMNTSYKSVYEYYEANGLLDRKFGLWQNVMYPVYDKLMGKNPKDRYEFRSTESLINKTYRTEFEVIDNAISIELTDTINESVGISTPIRPINNWDWLLSKGVGAFTLNFTYKAGPNGLADTQGSTSEFSLDVNYIAITQLIVGLAYAIYRELSNDTKDEIPFRKNPIEIYDDRLTVTRTYSSGISADRSVTEKISEDEERLRQTPRRIHKKGNVLLSSRSGLYDTSILPCPIIFLGYSDDYFSLSGGARRSNIEKLSKNEIVENVCVGTNNLEIPSIKPRIKKYGRNPLLDVFYLNVVNPYAITDTNFPPTSGNRYSNERRWSNPNRLPFRSNRSKKNWHIWPELEYGEFPSIFPPNWQYMDQTNWNDRLKTTIIPMEQRWEFSIEYQNGNTDMPFVTLKDKTPILDIYFALMEMHVKGVSWSEILQYANTAISCVENNRYLEWRSENKTTINTEKLERLWRRIDARMEQIEKQEETKVFLASYDFQTIKINTQPIFGSTLIADSYGKVLIKNNSTLPFTIDNIYIQDLVDTTKPIDGNERVIVDVYERSPSKYFNIIDYPKTINSARNVLDYSEISIGFNSSETQPNFEYNVEMVINGKLGTESITLSSILRAKTTSDRVVNYYSDINPDGIISVPSVIDFGLVESGITDNEIKKWSGIGFSIGEGQPNLTQLVITNYSEYDSIRLDKIYLSEIELTDYSGNILKKDDQLDTSFYVMDTKQILIITSIVGKNTKLPYIFPPKSIIKPSKNIENCESRIVYLSLLPKNKNTKYKGKMTLDYTILPRFDNSKFTTDGIRKQKTINLYGAS